MKKRNLFLLASLFGLLISSNISFAQCPIKAYCSSEFPLFPSGAFVLELPDVPVIGDNYDWEQSTNPIVQFWAPIYNNGEGEGNAKLYFDFGECDDRTGSYTIQKFKAGVNFDDDPDTPLFFSIFFKYLLFDNPELCNGDMSNFAVRIGENQWCVFKNGILCPSCSRPECDYGNAECDDWFEDCGDILNPAIKKLQDRAIDISCEQWAGDCGIEGLTYRSGGVAIGVEQLPNVFGEPQSPKSNKLAVRGGILTEQIKLHTDNSIPGWGSVEDWRKQQGWCDYVFDSSYPLMSIEELEKYIATNKHLPRTPSAQEIKDQGYFEIGDVILNHQEKLEEVFLYLIQIQNQLEETKNEISKLKAEN